MHSPQPSINYKRTLKNCFSPIEKYNMFFAELDEDIDPENYSRDCEMSVKLIEYAQGFVHLDGYSTPPPLNRTPRFEEVPADKILCGTLCTNIIFHDKFSLCENSGKLHRHKGTEIGHPKGLYCCLNAYFQPSIILDIRAMTGKNNPFVLYYSCYHVD